MYNNTEGHDGRISLKQNTPEPTYLSDPFSPLYTTFQAVHFFLEKQFWERWDVERGKRREDRDPGSLDWWNNKLKEPGGAGWREKYEMLLRKTKRKIQSETNWKWNLFLHGPIPYPWFLKHTSHTLRSQTSSCWSAWEWGSFIFSHTSTHLRRFNSCSGINHYWLQPSLLWS